MIALKDIPALDTGDGPVVFLDTARPSTGNAHSYLFRDPVMTVVATRFDQVLPALSEVERLSRGYWMAGFVAYEAAFVFEERLAPLCDTNGPCELPLLWFGAFSRPAIFDHRTGLWDCPVPMIRDPLREQQGPVIRHTLHRKDYTDGIAVIKRWIARGHTYQVNFTYDVTVHDSGGPAALYHRLRANQPTPYCSFIRTPYGHVLSFSPELFFARRGRTVTMKPMKGTAPRGRFVEEDHGVRAWLAADEKNRAENVMIVDLLRNDLGRLCRPSTVRTRALFAIETHPTVHQMTSTVTGELRPGTGLEDLFRALLPCGSVTGAPKIRTMEIIHQLERGPRGVYCGAIGFVSPGGEAKFCVPIRTLQQGKRSRRWRYRVGSGVVWGSDPGAEWEECGAKCAFLQRNPRRFELLETILYRNGFRYLKEHRARFRTSAAYFGFPLAGGELERTLRRIREDLGPGGPCRVRILLASDGTLRSECAPMNPARPQCPVVRLAGERIDEREVLLYHKTTWRPWYAQAAASIAAGECYDVLYTNSRGEITEGARSNVFVRIDGELVTPPVACGLLPGVLRHRLIASGKCRERILRPSDLRRAKELYCGNSVRGLVRVSC